MLILAVLVNEKLKGFMSSRFVSSFGKYTFSLYLIHLAVIYTVATPVFMSLHTFVGYNAAVLAALLAIIPVIWAATVLFERFIDAPSVRFAKYISDVYDGKIKLKVSRARYLYRYRYIWARKKISDHVVETSE
jgi:peptidoglycan/LPS O-acetylase OafA/YrhL